MAGARDLPRFRLRGRPEGRASRFPPRRYRWQRQYRAYGADGHVAVPAERREILRAGDATFLAGDQPLPVCFCRTCRNLTRPRINKPSERNPAAVQAHTLPGLCLAPRNRAGASRGLKSPLIRSQICLLVDFVTLFLDLLSDFLQVLAKAAPGIATRGREREAKNQHQSDPFNDHVNLLG